MGKLVGKGAIRPVMGGVETANWGLVCKGDVELFDWR